VIASLEASGYREAEPMRNIHVTVTTGASLFSILEELVNFHAYHQMKTGADAHINLTIHAGVETLANHKEA
jgi:hypothetical protein